ncbi:hypothetical protein ADL22_24310 [Streptomyces sp. NRRL F-4489]|nr:hypothetical protein ADL22_24310 [Streptomyces sp. NRRL F-4489]
MVLALGTLIGVPFLVHSDYVGTAHQRRRRYEEMIRSFDGRPEVTVRVHGTGMTAEQTVLLARRYGYVPWEWESSRTNPRELRMRRCDVPHPPPYGPAPASPVAPEDMSAISAELSRLPDPNRTRRASGVLLAIGIGVGIAACRDVPSGSASVPEAVVATLLLAGAGAVAWRGRRAAGRRAGSDRPAPGDRRPPHFP